MTMAQPNVRGTTEMIEGRSGAAIGRESAGRRRVAVTVRIGRVMSGLVIAFLLVASVLPKLFLPQVAEQSMHQLGWNPKHLLVIAVVELVGTLLYAIPRTAPVGAVLLTGLLGGAAATHLRVEDPLFSHTLFPVWVGIVLWGGLWLRSAPLRALLRTSLLGPSRGR